MITTTRPTPVRFAASGELSDPVALAGLLGPIEEMTRSPMEDVGFSGASFERLRVLPRAAPMRSLVVKRVPLGRDWISLRTGDRVGRTAAFLATPELAPAWEVFHCPYLAYASDDREMALLMEDVEEHLFPDERTPLSRGAEDALLTVLAALHTRFRDAPVLDASWLTPIGRRLDLLSPGERGENTDTAPPPMLRDGLERGWSAALRRVPPAIRDGLTAPADHIAGLWRDLPRTLLHGDTKVANFALLPGGRVSAFDWSLVGAGPPGLELGWYLSMNATRLSRTREGFLERYRELLEEALGRRIPPGEWEGNLDLAAWSGARAMLWSKALALEGGREGAEEEWEWWVDRLGRSPLP